MNIISIEPTPSPNTMKLNIDQRLDQGISLNYTEHQLSDAPEYLQKILSIHGVKGVYQAADFIAVERYPKADWKDILSAIREAYGTEASNLALQEEQDGLAAGDSFGEIQVFVQMFKDIPMQVKLTTPKEERRFGLPERFSKAALEAQKASKNLVMERKWVEQGVRYGEMNDVGEEVVSELAATYSQERLDQLVHDALHTANEDGEQVEQAAYHAASSVTEEALDDASWEKRFAALERMNPTKEDIPILAKALQDSNQSVRRLATMYLGMIGDRDVLPYLYQALKDRSVSIRRTAGDALSDIGDPNAIGPMIEALSDPNKLVRWRAARFLYEIGDESALEALRDAEHDPEFEVSLQVRMALERIERGEAASGTVWQQMTRKMSENRTD